MRPKVLAVVHSISRRDYAFTIKAIQKLKRGSRVGIELDRKGLELAKRMLNWKKYACFKPFYLKPKELVSAANKAKIKDEVELVHLHQTLFLLGNLYACKTLGHKAIPYDSERLRKKQLELNERRMKESRRLIGLIFKNAKALSNSGKRPGKTTERTNERIARTEERLSRIWKEFNKADKERSEHHKKAIALLSPDLTVNGAEHARLLPKKDFNVLIAPYARKTKYETRRE